MSGRRRKARLIPAIVVAAFVRSTSATGGAVASFRDSSVATPVGKVVQLLSRLRAKLEDEGKVEAKEYDAYACFCKEQVSEKTYEIDRSKKVIDKFAAEVNSLEGEIGELNNGIKDATKRIADIVADIEAEKVSREAAQKAYIEEDEELAGAIEAIKGAIAALKQAKEDARDVGDMQVDFAQVRETLRSLKPAALDQLGKALSADAGTSNSDDVIKALETLRKSFSEQRKEQDVDNLKATSGSDERLQDLEFTKKSEDKDKADKERLLGERTEAKENALAQKFEEESGKHADDKFLEELTTECQNKARLWDQRSKSRSEELHAIAAALDALEKGLQPKTGATEGLAVLQARKVEVRPHSFLQIRELTSDAAAKASAVRDASAYLARRGRDLRSGVLLSVAGRVQASPDKFTKVRQLIKSFLDKLAADSEAEATQKAFCDKAMSETVANRDKAQMEAESLLASQATKTAARNELKSDIAKLEEGLAEAKKGLLEASVLRKKESLENDATVRAAQEGKQAVEFAMEVLKEYYGTSDAFLQASYEPSAADRDGKTVGDRAPPIFNEAYEGNSEASKGIMGLLEVISSDCERTINSVSEEEKNAQSEFDKFRKDTESLMDTMTTSKTSKEGQVVELEDSLADVEQDLHAQRELGRDAGSALDKLKSQCVADEESYEARVEARKREVESLREAIRMLEEWQH